MKAFLRPVFARFHRSIWVLFFVAGLCIGGGVLASFLYMEQEKTFHISIKNNAQRSLLLRSLELKDSYQPLSSTPMNIRIPIGREPSFPYTTTFNSIEDAQRHLILNFAKTDECLSLIHLRNTPTTLKFDVYWKEDNLLCAFQALQLP